jgi:hypothetical protein
MLRSDADKGLRTAILFFCIYFEDMLQRASADERGHCCPPLSCHDGVLHGGALL